MNGQCCPSNSPMLSEQALDVPKRLPSIPEEEPLVLEDDAVCDSIQARRRTQSEDEELWCQRELQKALDTLMRSEYAAPFVDTQSRSSISLQAIDQNLQCGMYVNNVDLFWSDVETCWDTSGDICDTERKSAHNQRSSAFIKRFFMANQMRALTSELEMDFWNSLSVLQQHLPDEDTQLNACGSGCSIEGSRADACRSACSTEMEVLRRMDSWVMESVADLGDWLFSSEVVNEM